MNFNLLNVVYKALLYNLFDLVVQIIPYHDISIIVVISEKSILMQTSEVTSSPIVQRYASLEYSKPFKNITTNMIKIFLFHKN